MVEVLYPWIQLLGRILFAQVFILSGVNHFVNLQGMAGYAESKEVPAAGPATMVSGLVFLLGGVMIVLGWYPDVAAWGIAIMVFLTAVLMHQYWKEEDPTARMNEMTHFQKDLALCGAALLVAWLALEAWPMELGGRLLG